MKVAKNTDPKLHWAVRTTLVLIGIVIVVSFVLMMRFWWLNHNRQEQIGVSFSQVQAERYGSDWQKNFTSLMDELGFRHIRIAAYWDRLEPKPDVYDFSQTDYMVNEASKRGAKLTMVIGQKSLRVPECYYPAWLDKTNSEAVHDESLKMLEAVVNRYKNNPTIEKWQLENEFLLKSFGDCPAQNLNSKDYQAEYNLVKSLDSSRPIVITQSNQNGFPVRLPYGNIFGFSMYRWVWSPFGYFRYPQTGLYFWWKAAIINLYTRSEIKIHELQAEAWGKVGNENLNPKEAFATMNPKILYENIEYARQSQIREFDLWGSEWWYWLKENGHPEMWEAIKTIPNKN